MRFSPLQNDLLQNTPVKTLVLGGGGMLGHQLTRALSPEYEVWATYRRTEPENIRSVHAICQVDALNPDVLEEVFRRARPDAVINCIGLIKQLPEAKDTMLSIAVNSLLPHRIARLARIAGARMIHISTDCVFSGRKGNYSEADPSDAEDLYGKSKYLGEIHDGTGITLRTSIIGRELASANGLIEWFRSQDKKIVKGYQKAIFSGLTTPELSRVIIRVLQQADELSGLWHVSSTPITKFELLTKAAIHLNWSGTIVPETLFECDRSLNSDALRSRLNYVPPSWDTMLAELI